MNNMVRILLVIFVVVLLLIVVGWLTIGSPNGNPAIQVDTEKVEQDTGAMVEATKNAIGDAAQTIDDNVTIGSED